MIGALSGSALAVSATNKAAACTFPLILMITKEPAFQKTAAFTASWNHVASMRFSGVTKDGRGKEKKKSQKEQAVLLDISLENSNKKWQDLINKQ